MSNFLTFDSVSAITPDGVTLFSNLTMSLGAERIGLVGRNGAGKSTLFDLIECRRAPATGTIYTNGRIARLEQTPSAAGGDARALLGVTEALACLDRLERGEGSLDDAAEADWLLPERLEASLREVGFGEINLTRPVASFSGGERTRLALVRLLLAEPDLILLDEPTNNLDAAGRADIHRLVRDWKGGMVIASHDRDLLEHMDRIIHLSPVGITVVTGGWSEFERIRREALAGAAHAEAKARQGLAQAERQAQKETERKARRDKQGRAQRAQRSNSKLFFNAQQERAEDNDGRSAALTARALSSSQAELEQARQQVEIITPLTIDLPETYVPGGKQLASLKGVEIKRNGRSLFAPVDMEIAGPSRWALCGANGSGKSSLIKLILGELQASVGEFVCHTQRIAHLDQHVSIIDREISLLDNLMRCGDGLSQHDAHAVLARFAFRNRDALKPGSVLSGGELMRAGLALAFSGAKSPELLILDEPTNHLDIESVAILEQALSYYAGALLVVSHDERFLQNIAIERKLVLYSAE